MHRGVSELVRWLEQQKGAGALAVQPPAKATDVQALEHDLGTPLPADLRLVLGRFNGAALPGGAQLFTAAPGPGATIESALRELAAQKGQSFLDPDLLLPFARTEHGSLLAFDRAAAPIADTWPIVDFDAEANEATIVHRTFDGWCRQSVAEWSAADRDEPFSLDKYVRSGARHAAIEPDVSTAHVTLGHGLRRAGDPERALIAYLRAGRCVPPVPWADWEALKLASLLDDADALLEAAARLAKRAPEATWARRGTTPSRVAFVLARAMRRLRPAEETPWRRLLELLRHRATDDADRAALAGILDAVDGGGPVPPPSPAQAAALAIEPDLDLSMARMREAYEAGQLRDDDLVLDPRYDAVAARYPLVELVRIRREFG
jgi:hypothetical protein